MRPLPSLVLLCAALAGCANTMRGQVDGEPVGPAHDAIFQLATTDLGLLGTYHWIGLAITGASDACEGLDEMEELGGDCVDACEDLDEIAHDHLPANDMWTLWLVLASDDDITGVYPHTDQADFDGFGATIEHADVEALRDFDECVDACEDGDIYPSDTDNSTGGQVEITEYESREQLQGTYSIEFGADVVEGQFKASWCEIFDL